MKKISILGILAILVIVAEFTYAMIAGWVDMKNLKSATPFPKCYLHKEKWTFDS